MLVTTSSCRMHLYVSKMSYANTTTGATAASEKDSSSAVLRHVNFEWREGLEFYPFQQGMRETRVSWLGDGKKLNLIDPLNFGVFPSNMKSVVQRAAVLPHLTKECTLCSCRVLVLAVKTRYCVTDSVQKCRPRSQFICGRRMIKLRN